MIQAEIRNLLAEVLRKSVPDKLWDYLVGKGFVGEVMDEAADINYLADEAREILEAGGGSGSQEARAPKMLGAKEDRFAGNKRDANRTWERAVSILLARKATTVPSVISFRKEVLEGKLLLHKEVEDWIKDHAKQDGPATTWLEVPVMPVGDRASSIHQVLEHRVLRLGDVISPDSPYYRSGDRLPDLHWRAESGLIDGCMPTVRHVEYSVPNSPWIRVQAVARAGVLGRLLEVSGGLQEEFPWKTGQATMFVLTGLYPEVRRVESGVRGDEAATRIYLFIDPAVPPREVADRYQLIRDDMLLRARRGLKPRRFRGMSDKHLHLAAFVAECPENQTWQEKMRAWNEAYPSAEYPGYGYKNRRLFSRDAAQAQNRLLHPDYWRRLDFFDHTLPEAT